MTHAEDTLTPAQMAALVDAAFQTRHPLAYFDTAMATFRAIRRDADAAATAMMGFLYAEGEIELLMSLRATWKRGQVRDPESILG